MDKNCEPFSTVRTRTATATELASAGTQAVRLKDVTKSYVRGASVNRVVNKVNLEVDRGECVFLLGPSGSGKTTLLSIIGCVLSADSGQVQILGQSVCGLDLNTLALLRRRHIGFVFQRFHLIRGLTASENVAVPLTLSGWKAEDSTQRAMDLLARVGMQDLASQLPHRMSVGQCQRVAFARALAADPELILADEPTASLDANAGQQAMELLRLLTNDARKTVIVVTHDPRILHFADRILHMENGILDERDPTDDVMMGVVAHPVDALAATQ